MSMSQKAVMAILAALVIMLLAAERASAQTCGFTISNMNFGSDVDTISGGAVDTTATLAYNCSGGDASARVLICPSLGEGSVTAAANARRMAGGSSHLLYQLYQNSERSVIWGSSGTASPPPPIVAILDGNGAASDSRAIYGRLFGGQSTAEATAYTSSFSGIDVDIRYRVTDDNDCSGGLGTSGGAVSFSVNATVAEKCLVSTVPVNFGSHSTLSTNIDASGSVSVTCTPATSYAIRLNGGNAAAGPTARKMFKGLETITYGLYRNSEHSQPWGDTEGTTMTGTGSGGVQAHTVYGRVAPQATPPVGTYTDTVIVVVDY
jgi:spore coat protein U-like protein